MAYEVHLYLGTALIGEKSNYDYAVGEKHAFLFYLRADVDADYDELEAESIIENAGLDNVEFSRVGKVSPEKAASSEKKQFIDSAIKTGSCIVLYGEPII
nr:hypothetical protein [uncultured Mucilaginibacter sp.]